MTHPEQVILYKQFIARLEKGIAEVEQALPEKAKIRTTRKPNSTEKAFFGFTNGTPPEEIESISIPCLGELTAFVEDLKSAIELLEQNKND